MTDNTQELDEILNTYAKAYYEAKHESEFNTCDWAMDKAKQAVLDWHNRQILEPLGRLLVEVKQAYDKEGDFLEMAVDTIEAERNKLEAEL